MVFHFRSEAEERAFSNATCIIMRGYCPACWKHDGVDEERLETLWSAAKDYMTPYDTPSGYLHTALDKFINRYVMQGYKWIDNGDDSFTFAKGKEVLTATPHYDEENHVLKYTISGFLS